MLATTRAKEIIGTSREFRFESVTSLADNHRLTQHQFRMLHGIAETKLRCVCARVSENIIFNWTAVFLSASSAGSGYVSLAFGFHHLLFVFVAKLTHNHDSGAWRDAHRKKVVHKEEESISELVLSLNVIIKSLLFSPASARQFFYFPLLPRRMYPHKMYFSWQQSRSAE